MKIIPFNEALAQTSSARARYLLLGNGFSIALRPDIFTYGSLFDKADFSDHPHIPDLFAALKTNDFELVIKNLVDTKKVLEVYAPWETDLINQLSSDAEAVKSALVTAIASRHPDRPYDIDDANYACCRLFLWQFKHIFTLNYDVLLYWALMQTEVDDLRLRPDDGFRHPEDDADVPYVSWQQAHTPNVYYLHGALHLFDAGHEIIKYTWSKTSVSIVDQIREALDQQRYPLFVSEGSSQSKLEKIIHNAYLHKGMRSFEACCSSPSGNIVIFGHSLADNDAHFLRLIARGKVPTVLVSIYGDPEADWNKAVENQANRMIARRAATKPRDPLEIIFYNAQSAKIWS